MYNLKINKPSRIFYVTIGLLFIISVSFFIIKYGFLWEKNTNIFPEWSKIEKLYPTARIIVKDTTLQAAVADTKARQELGLGGLSSLPEGKAMLFSFDYSDRYGFWMKDMKFPIDIFWISDNFKIVHIEKSVSPDSFPKTFTPSLPARFVLETNADFAKRHQIDVGEDVNIIEKK